LSFWPAIDDSAHGLCFPRTQRFYWFMRDWIWQYDSQLFISSYWWSCL